MEDRKLKTITVHFKPELDIPPIKYSTYDSAGYAIQSDENGIIGYRVWTDRKTYLFPKEEILVIETDF